MDEAPAKTFQDLTVWQQAHQFVLAVYNYSDYFPPKEVYSLTAQLRRAAVSIPANIAEGFKKESDVDASRFVNLAQGAIEECRYYLILAKDLGYGDSEHPMSLLEEVSKLLQRDSAARLTTDS
jgi:four helix bundle protein